MHRAKLAAATLMILALTTPTRADQPAPADPVPAESALRAATKVVQEVYKNDFAAAKRPDEKAALAAKLLKAAEDTRDDPTSRYALLQTTRELAIEVGAASSAIQAADLLGSDYATDALSLRVETLAALSKSARTPAERKLVLGEAEPCLDAAIAADRYDLAKQLTTSASLAAQRLGVSAFNLQWLTKTGEVDELSRRYAEVSQALNILKTNPTDPAANLTAGRFYCFTKGEWPRGLPMLGLATDADLKKLALADLAGGGGISQIELGDLWWDAAEKRQDPERRQMRIRAIRWYRDVLAGLTGLNKARVEGRIHELFPPLFKEVTAYTFSRDKPNLKMIRQDAGVCVLTSLGGAFDNKADLFEIKVGSDSVWRLTGPSNRSISAKAAGYAWEGRSWLPVVAREFEWKKGSPPIKLISQDEGFCFLSSIGGAFDGAGEEVRLRIGEDGFWYLDGRAARNVQAGATVVRLANRGLARLEVRQYVWRPSTPPVRMIHRDEGLCFLGGIGGQFAGGGETVAITVGEDGYCYLGGKSMQRSLTAHGISVRIVKPTPSP